LTLSTLLKEVRACDICAAALPHGTRPVLQAGAKARILIAGQAPGRKVHESGVLFDDPSGDRLRDWLQIDREVFYDPDMLTILPMGFCYPGAGKSGDLPPRPECAPQWRRQLLDFLPNIELTLVVGQYAQAHHLPDNPHKNLTETVRAWQDFWPNALSLPHPSPRNNIWMRKNPWFEADVLPALRGAVHRILSSTR
jgi:uracil-DNA glycosylase